ncbi:amidase [Pseudomonas deceptionensis]|uniref:Asp-tRNAAsn/Glu-tRNAGln amidotransferase A subunit n=1 Tax=Pseudomonas deceptionensis TaxID=882211 RepID=A0A0J6GBP2_PSEDM|nr:amidase [Pseudomonas deceptionensis]KMM79080.1 glutamyl-tRNA amidotransferase [Pseudomonas deceptionensis]SEF04969.1 Asp-tRNAAsn/Glu-tRNAGln amidotransferase A subunit [Pseudomonas deceptionensis]
MSFLDTADAHSIAEQVRTARLSPGIVAEHFLAQTSARESAIQAFVALDPQVVRKQAQGLSSPGINGLLAGVPVGVKDIIDTRDHPTGFYSPIYDNNWPSRDAHVVALLRQAGAVIMGKTHTTEFAYMHTGPTRNPLDLNRTPGSSSAGSAAGMAAGFFPVALGTQTAGSLLKPAAYCGLYAFKPSYGLVSLEGIKPLAPSFDTLGWYGRSVRDLGLVAQVLIPGLPHVTRPSGPRTFGFCRTASWDQVDPLVADALLAAVDRLKAAGHSVTMVELPDEFAQVFDDHLLINDCEGARSLSKEWQSSPELLSPSVVAMIERAKGTTWEQESAAKARLAVQAHVLKAIFAPFDTMLSVTCGMVAPLGLETTGPSDFCKFWMAFGLPQINIPLPRQPGEMPVGLQVIGGFREDSALLDAAGQVDLALRG